MYNSNSLFFFCSWWDCIALPDDVDPSDESAFKMQIKDLACTVWRSPVRMEKNKVFWLFLVTNFFLQEPLMSSCIGTLKVTDS